MPNQRLLLVIGGILRIELLMTSNNARIWEKENKGEVLSSSFLSLTSHLPTL
jgi:hypothetical protein